MKIIMCLVSLMVVIGLVSCARDGDSLLKDTSQNWFEYFDVTQGNKPLLTPEQQKLKVTNFFKHYFSPWTGNERLLSDRRIYQLQEELAQKYLQDPGWDENHAPHSTTWTSQIIDQMDLVHFPNAQQKAITIRTSNLRVLPTEEPSFTCWDQEGEGYPFDNLQNSFQPANAPVLILHKSKSGAWSLVLTATAIGWMPSKDLALVDSKFMQQWQTGKYLAPLRDHLAIIDNKQQFQFDTRLGAVHPLNRQLKNQYEILVAEATDAGKAVIKTAIIDDDDAVVMPFALTPNHLAQIGNYLLGKPYGWGGLYGYRDCSSTLMDLFTPFGIWLPRNSWDQTEAGEKISFKNLTNQEKLQIIHQQAKPFLSLIGQPGHIVLYLGEWNQNMYVFQNKWGLHTRKLWRPDGRLIIGKAFISPLNLGKGFLNISSTLLDDSKSLTILH